MAEVHSKGEIEKRIRIARDTPFDSILGVRSRYDSLTSDCAVAVGTSFEPINVADTQSVWAIPLDCDPDALILFLHGGGFLTGSVKSHSALASYLADATRSRVLILNYRLGPESPFPAAQDDALLAYEWLFSQGVKPEDLTVFGDSAGGGLAISTLSSLVGKGLPMPSSCVVVGPMCDLEMKGASYTVNAAKDPWMTVESHQAVIGAFLRDASPTDPRANPLYADLEGLPPTLIQVSNEEMLLDDSIMLSQCLNSAGVDVTLQQWEGVFHDWHMFVPLLHSSTKALSEIAKFVEINKVATK